MSWIHKVHDDKPKIICKGILNGKAKLCTHFYLMIKDITMGMT